MAWAGQIAWYHREVDEVTRVIPSLVGPLALTAASDGLRRVDFVDAGGRQQFGVRDAAALRHLDAAEEQLCAYFVGERRTFDLVLAPRGTEFQLAAWRVLQTIPYGRTITYGEQARALGKPNAMRAVGGANGRNPLAIVVPCHRVIGSGGRLTGYASGLDRKAWLLALEGQPRPV